MFLDYPKLGPVRKLPNVVALTGLGVIFLVWDHGHSSLTSSLARVANSARAATRLYSSSSWVVLPAMVAAKRVLPWGITSLTSLEFVAASPCALPSLSSLRCASAALTLPPSSSLPSTQSRPRPTQDPDDAPAPPLVRLVPHASPGRVLYPTALLFLAHLCRLFLSVCRSHPHRLQPSAISVPYLRTSSAPYSAVVRSSLA